MNYDSVRVGENGEQWRQMSLGRGREMNLTTKFVTKFLTRYSLKLEITIATIDYEVCARPVSDIPNEPSQ